jgi:hypothetical protein
MFPKILKKVESYLKEKRLSKEAKNVRTKNENIDEELNNRYKTEHPIEPQDKVLRESGGQDITAI